MQKLGTLYIVIILLLFFIAYYYFRLDDAYIFYQYAGNIAEGNGYVFNIGEKVNATTSPLYTLILASIYWITKHFFIIDFVLIGNFVSIASISIILYSAKRIIKDDYKFYFFALMFLATPLLKFGFGMETFLNLALIFISVYLYIENKLIAASAFIGLSVLARFDSLLFGTIIFLHYIITNKKFPPPLSIIVFLSVITPWMIFSKLYFDSFLPTTIAAKLSQHKLGLFGEGMIFITNFSRVIPGGYLTIASLLTILLVGSFYIYKNRIRVFDNNGIKILLIWSAAMFIFYSLIINAPPYQWYYTPYAIPVAIIFAVSISGFVQSVSYKKFVISILFITACVLPVKNLIEGYNPKYLNFTGATTWLNNNSVKGDLIAADDIGILGFYYTNGKIVDALGLINPDVSAHLMKKEYDWFLSHYTPGFIVHEYPELQPHLRGDEKTFWQNYEVTEIFESAGQRIAIYKKININ
jgi:arabinofuranosyltransferase